jgi:hypothetical protein
VLVNRGWIPAALMNDIAQRRAMLVRLLPRPPSALGRCSSLSIYPFVVAQDRVSGDTRLFGLIRPGEKVPMEKDMWINNFFF